jgi:hypothetical protein
METVTLYTMYRGHIMFFTLIAITTQLVHPSTTFLEIVLVLQK